MLKIKVPLGSKPQVAVQPSVAVSAPKTATPTPAPAVAVTAAPVKVEAVAKPEAARKASVSEEKPRVSAPQAEFVKDVTLLDHSEVVAGSVVRKVWAVKNTGAAAWPEGVSLVFIGGPLTPENADAKIVVPQAKPGEIVELAADIKIPVRNGRAYGNFRLSTAAGVRFGSQIWCDVTIVPKSIVATPAPVAVPVPVATKPEPVAAPVLAKKESKADEVKPSVDRVPSGGNGQKFKYQKEIEQLQDMGYKEPELLMYLLGQNKGDVGRCVEWLIKWNKGGAK